MKSDQARVVTLNDLAELTLRANVAFAVRCAQRVRPCFKLPAEAPRRREQTAAVDEAIRVASAFCRGLPEAAGRAAAAARAAGVVAQETGEFTRYAGYAAAHGASAAAHAEEVVRDPKHSCMTDVVAAAFGAGRVVVANVDAYAHDLVVAALHADLVQLLLLAAGTTADLGPPVDPSETGPLGPLWPAGVPACFAPEAEQPPRTGE
jgi:hypothetical protein